MRRILSILVLAAFAFIMQMPFLHAVEMEMDHDMSSASVTHSMHDSARLVLCDRGESGKSESCYNEIPESKYIEHAKKTELGVIFTAIIFFILFAPLLELEKRLHTLRRKIYLHYDTLYLTLYGIIRNVN